MWRNIVQPLESQTEAAEFPLWIDEWNTKALWERETEETVRGSFILNVYHYHNIYVYIYVYIYDYVYIYVYVSTYTYFYT